MLFENYSVLKTKTDDRRIVAEPIGPWAYVTTTMLLSAVAIAFSPLTISMSVNGSRVYVAMAVVLVTLVWWWCSIGVRDSLRGPSISFNGRTRRLFNYRRKVMVPMDRCRGVYIVQRTLEFQTPSGSNFTHCNQHIALIEVDGEIATRVVAVDAQFEKNKDVIALAAEMTGRPFKTIKLRSRFVVPVDQSFELGDPICSVEELLLHEASSNRLSA